MSRRALVVLSILALPACVTETRSVRADTDTSPPPRAARSGSEPSTGAARVGDYAMTVPENVVWIPWKIVGRGFRGASDGVSEGFQQGGMPAVSLLFSPINLVVGLVNGVAEGLFMAPALIGPDEDFGRTMGLPVNEPTNVWWY